MNSNPRNSMIGRTSAVALLLATILLGSAAIAAEPKQDGDDAKLRQELAEAQKRLDKAAREVAELSMSLSKDAMSRAMAVSTRGAQRAMLGIGIGTDEDDDDNDEGVEVLSVSPGGPAAEAGIKSGDVLLSLNNKSLKRDDDDSPREKLLEVMRGVKPGEKVVVKYQREGRGKSCEVVTKSITDRFYSFTPDFGKAPSFAIPDAAIRRVEGVLGSAELVALTPKLGEYFGTEKGLLVVRAPTDTSLEIEEGDVIVEIDGRTPTSPAHAARILSSYSAGETVNFSVLRKKRRTNVEFVIPEDAPRARIERRQRLDRSDRLERFERPQNLPARPFSPRSIRISPPAPPAPPAQPAPPAAPAPAAPPAPPVVGIAPLPPTLEIQVLPDVDVEVGEVY